MILSNSLFKNLTENLELEYSELESERVYTTKFTELTLNLKQIKDENYRNLSLLKVKSDAPQDIEFIVRYIVSISFTKANTIVHVSDSEGNLKLFYSAGIVGLTGKQKKKRRVAVFKLISCNNKILLKLGA